jgi:arylsulfatase
VIAAMGGLTSGWSLYLKDRKPTYYYNFFEVAHYQIQSPQPLPNGKATITIQVAPVEDGFGKPRAVLMSVNGKKVAVGRVEKSVPFRYGVEPFDIGMDTVSAVSSDYKVPNAFTGGAIDSVAIDVGPVKLSDKELEQLKSAKEGFLLQTE